ncbi:MAG: hypothetical protein QOE79_279 [Sphingomonadales bacterium]|jgi:hypothetical protein|nr:hypothetical protein [Sphingomonadales bacterium]
MPVDVPSFLRPAASVAPAAAAAPGGADKLDFTMARQDLSNWCWAATTVSVRSYYDHVPPEPQCAFASTLVGWDCCPPGNDGGPNDILWALDDALGSHLAQALPRALTFDEIVGEIAARRPICCHVTIGAGHFNAIVGYHSATREIDVADPLYGPHDNVPYDQFCSNYRGARWDYTYLTR